jgi:hypothetical protein
VEILIAQVKKTMHFKNTFNKVNFQVRNHLSVHPLSTTSLEGLKRRGCGGSPSLAARSMSRTPSPRWRYKSLMKKNNAFLKYF